MILKSALIVSAALLFVSAPAWADSVKPNAASATSSFSRSDVKRLGGFKTQGGRLMQRDVEPDGDSDDPTAATPEPGSMALLFTGLLCVGALAGALTYRRNQSLASA